VSQPKAWPPFPLPRQHLNLLAPVRMHQLQV
jgi:hypothetical protein